MRNLPQSLLLLSRPGAAADEIKTPRKVFHLNFTVLLDGTTSMRPVLDQWTGAWDAAKLLREVCCCQRARTNNGAHIGNRNHDKYDDRTAKTYMHT